MKSLALQLAEDALSDPKTKTILGKALHDGQMAELKQKSEVIDRAITNRNKVHAIGHLLDGVKIEGGRVIL